jgi:hypothetical protein
VTGQYIDFTGSPIAGQVSFTNPQFLVNSAADRMIVPTKIIATLDNTGAFSVTIPVTNDVDLAPLNFTYTFEESFIGGSTFTISLPTSLGGSVDISDLRPTATVVAFSQPASADLFPPLEARVEQEEEDLDDDPKLLADHTYENLVLFSNTYGDLASAFATYNLLTIGELNFTEARIQELIDRISDLYDYTASNLELRDTSNTGQVSRTTYGSLALKRGTYASLASAYATYGATTGTAQTWNYSQVGSLITNIGHALAGTGTLTDPYLSITRSVTDGSYGALALQGLTYATLASTYATYGSVTGVVFTFTYRDTADILRTEAYRLNRLLLIGAKQ